MAPVSSWLGRMGVGALACVAFASGWAGSALAAGPAPGRWEAVREQGGKQLREVFWVRGHGRGARVSHFAKFCTRGGDGVGDPYRFSAPTRISRRGRFHDRVADVRGRLRLTRGWIRDGNPPSTGAPDESTCKPLGRRLRVRRVDARPVLDGEWRLTGPWGTNARIRVDSGGAAITSWLGTWSGPPGSGAGTDPCVFANLGGTFRTYYVPPSGRVSFRDSNVTMDWQFTSAGAAIGTYSIRNEGAGACSAGPQPFFARVESVERSSPLPPAGRDLLDSLPGPGRPLSWAALGDSYSSGEGVSPYFKDSDNPADKCHRSPRAYSQLLSFAGSKPQVAFLACSGAVTDNVLRTTQYAPEGSPQALRPELNANVDLVTLSIGGNDVGFSDVLTRCIAGRIVRLPCALLTARRLLRKLRALPPKLAETYAAIRNRIGPNTSVFVLGYPQLMPRRLHGVCPPLRLLFPSKARLYLRRAGVVLRNLTRRGAARAGFHFVDVMPAFAGHEVCGARGEWINALVRRRKGDDKPVGPGSFHPNAAGQRGYAMALAAYILKRLTKGDPVTPAGLPANPAPRG